MKEVLQVMNLREPDYTYTTALADDAPLLTAQAIHEDGDVLVAVEGEMDLATAPALHAHALALLALPLSSLTLDLAALSFIDSSGLTALLQIREAAAHHNVALSLRSVPDQARQILDATGTDVLFTTD